MRAPTLHPFLAAALTLGSLLASGCFGAESPPSAAPVVEDEEPVLGANVTGGLGAAETNATVEGSGGKPHIHDYWLGRNKVVLFDDVVASTTNPVIPEGDPSKGIFMSRVHLTDGSLVFEGTGFMEILARSPEGIVQGLRMAYRSPDMDAPSDLVALPFDEVVEVALSPRMTDMPHATRSLWHWDFYSDGTGKPFHGSFHLTITIVKAKNVEAWPGHPDFYKDRTHRVVLDEKTWRTEHTGADEYLFFGRSTRGMLAPDLLVSMGTGRLVVFVNVTAVNSPGEPESFRLEYVNATQQSVKSRSPDEGYETGTELQFTINVDEGGHDSPYADKSRWGLRLGARFSETSICPTCMPYTLEYRISAIAYAAEPVEA